jgi:YjbE family integral membrane protein
MEQFMTPQFWVAVGQIIMIDILLGGDNAVVIALACRKLPDKQRTQGILWGTAGAIVLRVILIFFALTLLAIPYLKLIGAALLVWIGIKLLAPEEEDGHGNIQASDKLWAAVKTVIVADFVMSLDNVIAIAGAAETAGGGHQMPLVIFGLLVSIPIIVWGSQLVIKLMDRFPIIITLGGMLLGWIAGTMAVSDPAVLPYVPTLPAEAGKLPHATAIVHYGAGVAGALLVLALGKWVASRRATKAPPAAEAAQAEQRPLQCVLLAVDGSAGAAQAVRQWIALRKELRNADALELHLINVQRPVSGDVSSFVANATLEEYYRERSDTALAPARALLDAAGVTYTEHQRVGDPGPTIAELARRQNCDLIVMGTRGMDSRAAVLLGSVAQSTVEHANVPVLLSK